MAMLGLAATAPSTAATLYYEPQAARVLAPPGLPPFDLEDSLAVAECSRRASRKLEQARAEQLRHDAAVQDEVLLSRLPFYQNRIENPYRQGAIYCRSGGWLELLDERWEKARPGSRNASQEYNWVRGTKRETSRFAVLEFISIAFGLISIRGLESQNFLCMDWKGALYAAPADQYSAECVFLEEMLENYYNLYSSCAYGTARRPWYLSIRKSGKPRRGPHTRKRQRSSHFVAVHFDETGLLEPVPGHLHKAAYRLQNSWRSHYGSAWRRSSHRHRVWAPASLLDTETRALSELLANSLRARLPAATNKRRPKHNRTGAAFGPLRGVFAAALDAGLREARPMTELERRVFRQERGRRRRLFREERLREQRKMQLQQLRANRGAG